MLEVLAALIKTLSYVGVICCAGAVFAEATLRPSADGSQILWRLGQRAAMLIIFAVPASATCLFSRLGGNVDYATLSAVFLSSVGASMCLQLAGAILLLCDSVDDPSTRGMRVSNAALVTASFAFNGHAAAYSLATGIVVFIHVSLAAWWIASLWLLRTVAVRAEISDVAALVSRFSSMAFIAVGGLVIAGLMLVGALVNFDDDPWLSGYGQLLALKIALALVALSFASYNRVRVTTRLTAGDISAAHTLRKTIVAELICIGAVLIATALLTTYTSPHGSISGSIGECARPPQNRYLTVA